MDRDVLIKQFFEMGLKYQDIQNMLEERHNICIGLRHLRRLMRAQGLARRNYYDLRQVVDFIHSQLQESGQQHGYRIMHARCQAYGLNVRVNDVRLILKYMDPVGSSLRSARRLQRRQYYAPGPNFIWHLDGYDKMKPFGICVSGCICGFSRNVIWLNAFHTNNDPRVIGGYYLEAVEELGGSPVLLRGDYGTENVRVRDFQIFLMRNEEMYQRSYIEGTSTANQRIECWWGYLRREHMNYWIQTFSHIQDTGDFSGDFVDKNILRFCFLSLIQNELDIAKDIWNNHHIRPTRNSVAPSGRPALMYNFSNLWNARDYLCPVATEDIDTCKESATFRSSKPCDDDIYELCTSFLAEYGIAPPKDAAGAHNLYQEIRQHVRSLL